MSTASLELSRDEILAFRRRVGALDQRLPPGPESLGKAAWAGLQDSMPRAALLSIHARVEETDPDILEDPFLVQLWGPRFSAYVVAERDHAVFSLGRLPDEPTSLHRARDMATRLQALLGDQEVPYGEAGRALGVNHNRLRYGAPTGTILIRWDGARQPTVRCVPPPDVDPQEARLELARRYFHTFGPATPAAFAKWAGVKPRFGKAVFEALRPSLIQVVTPIGQAWILAGDEEPIRAAAEPVASVRLLPSGDTYFLAWSEDRELLVPDPELRPLLWTSRVWPGALLVDGEIVGTWRRSKNEVTLQPWTRLLPEARDAVAEEAASLPLPDVGDGITVRWSD